MKLIKKLTVTIGLLLLVSFVVPALPANHSDNGTVTINSDLPERDIV